MLKVLVIEEHLLQLGVGLTDIAKLVISLVYGGIGQLLSIVSSLVLLSLTAGNGVISKWNRIVPGGVSV